MEQTQLFGLWGDKHVPLAVDDNGYLQMGAGGGASMPAASSQTGVWNVGILGSDGTSRLGIDSQGRITVVLPSLPPLSGGSAVIGAVTQSGTWSVGVSGNVSISNFPTNQVVSGTVNVGNFPATQPISGNVTVGNFPASQTVFVSNFPATQPISGSITVSNFPAFPTNQLISGNVSISNFPATQPVSIAGSVNIGNFPATQTIKSYGLIPTYSAAITSLNSAALANDIFSIIGSSTKTIVITEITISGVATAAGAVSIQLIKRSTLNTGGTFTTPSMVPFDSSDSGATALVKAYTANPTGLGTSVGLVRSRKVTLTTLLASIVNIPTVFKFDVSAGKGITLKSNTESLCISLNGLTILGGSFDIEITWMEI